MPGWSEGEQGMVHELQAKLKIKPTGMPTKIAPLKECVQSVSANDSGEVSLGCADGPDHFSVEHPRRFLSSLGRPAYRWPRPSRTKARWREPRRWRRRPSISSWNRSWLRGRRKLSKKKSATPNIGRCCRPIRNRRGS
jgi:hypothetical protein